MVACIGCPGHNRASADGCIVLAKTSRRRAWRTCRSRRRADFALGANEKIANDINLFDWESVPQRIDISAETEPGTIGKGWWRLIEGSWALTGVWLSHQKPDKKIRRRYQGGSNDRGYECVRARIRDYTGCGRQHHRVSRGAIAIGIAPQYRSVWETIQTGIGGFGRPQAMEIAVMILLPPVTGNELRQRRSPPAIRPTEVSAVPSSIAYVNRG